MQDEANAHAASVENLIGDSSPEPPPLGPLSSVERLHLLQHGHKSAASTISQLESTRSAASGYSNAGYGGSRGGGHSRSGSLVSPAVLQQEQQQQPVFSAMTSAGTVGSTAGGGGHASWGGVSIDRLSIGASGVGTGESREDGGLSMAGEAALFWEVRRRIACIFTRVLCVRVRALICG